MAKKRNRSGQRDNNTIATLAAARPVKFSQPVLLSDRRQYHPDKGYAIPFSKRKYQARVEERIKKVVTKTAKRKVRYDRSVFGFAVPKRVELCIRRKQRREVLFAMRRTGKGSHALVRRRNHYSEVSCK